jgi:hypothetical protein
MERRVQFPLIEGSGRFKSSELRAGMLAVSSSVNIEDGSIWITRFVSEHGSETLQIRQEADHRAPVVSLMPANSVAYAMLRRGGWIKLWYSGRFGFAKEEDENGRCQLVDAPDAREYELWQARFLNV